MPAEKLRTNFSPPKAGFFRRFVSSLGPGLTTGAADDDPSGVATYSIAGAQFGTAMLWTAFVTWPLMGAVQMMCARIGMCTGKGLTGAFHHKFPHALVVLFAVALLAANTINVAADLAGMADAAAMMTGLDPRYFVVLFGGVIAFATVWLRYHRFATVLKWLALSLFAYVLTAFIIKPDWGAVMHDTFLPVWPHGRDAWGMLVAILGTTISPYLFYWQASLEVEEEKALGRGVVQRQGATEKEILTRKLDVGVGTFFSNVVMFFIILSTALTLHAHGLKHIETSREAAEALRPIAGSFAATLYTVGILGVGVLAIPTLTGSAAYAFAESFGWKQGLDRCYSRARLFYGVVIGASLLGIVLDFAGINPVKALYWSAIINGLLAPFLLTAVWLVASDRKIMCGQPSSFLSRTVVGVAIIAMFAAAIGMFMFSRACPGQLAERYVSYGVRISVFNSTSATTGK